MNELATLLNHDVVYYIKQCTIDEIKKDAFALYEYFNDHQSMPVEPSGGKQYNVWIQYMLNYTKTVKPVEDKFRNLYNQISESRDFDELQKLYPEFKDVFDKWYSLKRKFQFSGYYDFA